MGYASGVGLKHTTSTSRREGMNDQSNGFYIDYCIWSLDANRIYDTRMATQLSAQRGFWRKPENKGNLASKHTQGSTERGNGAIGEERNKEKVDDKKLKKFKRKKITARHSRSDRVAGSIISSSMIYRELPSGKMDRK